MFEEAISKIKRRLSQVVTRGVLNVIKDDKTSLLQISLLLKEIASDVEFFQPYGHASHPHPGAEVLSLAVGANKDHIIVVCANDKRYKIPLEEGESAIYASWGDKIVLKKNNIVEVTTSKMIINAVDSVEINTIDFKVNASAKAMFTTPLIEASANILATQNIVATAQMAAGAYVPMAGAGQIEMTGNVAATGSVSSGSNVSDSSGSMAGMRTTYNSHKHLDGTPKSDVPDSLM
jgi:phage baseplate assembly protein V